MKLRAHNNGDANCSKIETTTTHLALLTELSKHHTLT